LLTVIRALVLNPGRRRIRPAQTLPSLVKSHSLNLCASPAISFSYFLPPLISIPGVPVDCFHTRAKALSGELDYGSREVPVINHLKTDQEIIFKLKEYYKILRIDHNGFCLLQIKLQIRFSVFGVRVLADSFIQ
jgi:hypothetical protein